MSNKSQKEHKPLSLEEQRDEAGQDKTGRIKRYLDLADRLFKGMEGNEDPSPGAA